VLELGEAIEDGIRREVHEETRLEIEPIALTGVYKNMTRGIVALVFRAKITGGDIVPTEETAAFRWVTAGEITDLADKAYAVRVLDAVRPERAPAVRAHDGTRLV
jgi:8-oxo-dGTP diphosphatase